MIIHINQNEILAHDRQGLPLSHFQVNFSKKEEIEESLDYIQSYTKYKMAQAKHVVSKDSHLGNEEDKEMMRGPGLCCSLSAKQKEDLGQGGTSGESSGAAVISVSLPGL